MCGEASEVFWWVPRSCRTERKSLTAKRQFDRWTDSECASNLLWDSTKSLDLAFAIAKLTFSDLRLPGGPICLPTIAMPPLQLLPPLCTKSTASAVRRLTSTDTRSSLSQLVLGPAIAVSDFFWTF